MLKQYKVEKIVKDHGNGAHVLLPKELIGKKVIIELIQEVDSNGDL